jgi:archaeal type IV pilus assembly protein PilA
MKSRKDISPILATLLLIVIAVAIISVTYAWIVTYMNKTTDNAVFNPYMANVNFVTGTPNSVTIDIGNSGTASGQIVGVYAGTSASTMASMTPAYATGYTPTVTASGLTRFTISLAWTTDTTYYFRITPSSGVAVNFSQKSP